MFLLFYVVTVVAICIWLLRDDLRLSAA